MLPALARPFFADIFKEIPCSSCIAIGTMIFKTEHIFENLSVPLLCPLPTSASYSSWSIN